MANVENNGDEGAEVRGGPRTPEGKNISRRNAVKHGMSAITLLPDILRRDLVDEYYGRLREEWKPTTPTQDFHVREMARHQAALERIQQCEDAVLRRGATGALALLSEDGIDENVADVALAGAGTSDAMHRIVRYRRSHERAHSRSMETLREMGAQSHPQSQQPKPARQTFNTTAECQAYLVARVAGEDVKCPHCQCVQGSFLESRQVWQCRGCKRQRGIRTGTVMERSRINLLAWFKAIETILTNPDISVANLKAAMGIEREGTVRRVAKTIREAIESADRSNRLAGLDQIF
ncbi:MAG: transposase [Planctomycetes bacterium]|nr:transposase [Planctomycetota bacterium]